MAYNSFMSITTMGFILPQLMSTDDVVCVITKSRLLYYFFSWYSSGVIKEIICIYGNADMMCHGLVIYIPDVCFLIKFQFILVRTMRAEDISLNRYLLTWCLLIKNISEKKYVDCLV